MDNDNQVNTQRWVTRAEAAEIVGCSPATLYRQRDSYVTSNVKGKRRKYWLPSLLPNYIPTPEKSEEYIKAVNEVEIAKKLQEAVNIRKMAAEASRDMAQAELELEELKGKRDAPDKVDKLRHDVEDMIDILRQEILKGIADIEEKTKIFKQTYSKSVQEYNEHTRMFNENYRILNEKLQKEVEVK